MLEFLKIIADRLRLWMLLLSLGLSILLHKLFGLDGGWMIFLFCSSYLVLLGIEQLIRNTRERLKRESEQEARKARIESEEQYVNEQIWQRFNVLNEYNLEFVKSISSRRETHIIRM